MYAARYFAPRYWASRYWARGSDVLPPEPPEPPPPDHATVGRFRGPFPPPPRDIYLELALEEDQLMIELIAMDDEDDGRTWQ